MCHEYTVGSSVLDAYGEIFSVLALICLPTHVQLSFENFPLPLFFPKYFQCLSWCSHTKDCCQPAWYCALSKRFSNPSELAVVWHVVSKKYSPKDFTDGILTIPLGTLFWWLITPKLFALFSIQVCLVSAPRHWLILNFAPLELKHTVP